MLNNDILKLGNEFCARAGRLHDETNQMYGEYPYSEHIKRVYKEALNNIDTLFNLDASSNSYEADVKSLEPTILAILFGAAFHDSIEDARLTYNDVMKIAREYFDTSYATGATEIVYALTNEKGRNRAERASEKYYLGIRSTSYAPYVKLCDRLANLKFSQEQGSRMEKVYNNEMPHFLMSIGISEELYNKMK